MRNTVYLSFFVVLFLAASPLFAQSAEIDTFVQKVNGTGSLTATVQAADGGYVTVSRVNETGFLVMKIKASGEKQWERRLNFLDPNDNQASIHGVAQTTDGGFVLVGQSGFDSLQFDGVSAGILIKLRPNGTVAWQKSLDFSSYLSWFSSVIATSDGGFIAAGAIAQGRAVGPDLESLVVSFAATGEVVWAKNFKLLAHTSQVPVRLPLLTSTATSNNGFIVAFQKRDIRNQPLDGVDVMKITNSGNVVWEKSLKTGPAFVFRSAGKTAAGGVILIGNGLDTNKLRVIVLKANGTLNWTAGYSLKVPGNITSLSSPVQTLDGGYVVTGGAGTYGFIAKIDSSRKIVFQNTIGNTNANGADVGSSVFVSVDGGFAVFGLGGSRSLRDIFVLKVNSEGIVPGCGLLETLQFGSATRATFGPFRIAGVNITASNDLSFEPLDFGLNSFVTNHHVSTLCQ